MGQKIRPDSLRLGIIKNWNSRWFGGKNYKTKLEEDMVIRNTVIERIKSAGIVSIQIERDANHAYRILIKAARPGLIIGRGGQGIEELSKQIKGSLEALLRKRGEKTPKAAVALNIEELKRTEIAAQYVAQSIAWDLEKRLPFRRSMKKTIDMVMQNRDVEGVKIQASGRLDGAEIARREVLSKGKLPLQTLRANIEYGQATAYTTYGVIGIKVWVYKGLVFVKDEGKEGRNKNS